MKETMHVPFVGLKRQYGRIKDEITEAMTAVFKDSCFILGEKGKDFEKIFSGYIGMRHGIGAGINQNDEVITVPNTANATAAAIVEAGAVPVFIDIDEKTYLMDTEKIERAITNKTKAIIPVHLFGNCVDMRKVMEIAKKHGLIVIEDCAQAHGTLFKRKKAGSFGDYSCFSFYPTKNLGAYGDAGMILCNDDGAYERLKQLRQYGEKERHNSSIMGINSRMDEIQAAILIVKFRYLEGWNRERNRIAGIYRKGITNPKISLPDINAGIVSSFHLFVVQTEKREELREYLKRQGIDTAIHYPFPIPLQEAYKHLGHKKGDFPIAEKIMRSMLSIPLFPEMTDEEIGYVIRKINEY